MAGDYEEEELTPIIESLANGLREANGDARKERMSVEKAVTELASIYSGDTPAELLRDGDGQISGAFDLASADDEESERWDALISEACGY